MLRCSRSGTNVSLFFQRSYIFAAGGTLFFIDEFRLSDSLTNRYIYVNSKKRYGGQIKRTSCNKTAFADVDTDINHNKKSGKAHKPTVIYYKAKDVEREDKTSETQIND